jgi:hypothetical protein
MKKFEEGQLYIKHANGYKVTYRISKRTAKKIYFYSVAVETDEPINKFDASVSCNKVPGLINDIGDLFKEKSVTISEARFWASDYECFTIWNDGVGPIELSCLNKA